MNASRQASGGLEDRPFVTVSYAQSIDGSIAEFPDHPLSLSGELSLSLTHAIRAAHGAILVGIGTVLADNPALTVRYAAGENPQPVILDSRLRFPLFSPMLENPARRPWIFTNGRADPARMSTLRSAGAEIFTASSVPDGNLDLMAVLRKLREMGNPFRPGGGGRAGHNKFPCLAAHRPVHHHDSTCPYRGREGL